MPMPQPCQPSDFYSEEQIAHWSETLRQAVICLAVARRDALLQELAEIERVLEIAPTTSELRRAFRAQATAAQTQAVKLREGG